MKKILYSLSDLEDWNEVVEIMKHKHQWVPAYWIHNEKAIKQLEVSYRKTIFHSFLHLNRGLYAEKYYGYIKPLDEKVIKDFLSVEHNFMSLVNRHDPYRSLRYNERLKLYYRLLVYWLSVINELKIDLVLLTESPHSAGQYILYSVAKYLKVPTLMFSSTSMPGLVYLKENIEDTPEDLQIMQSNDIKKTLQVENAIHEYIQSLTRSEENSNPVWYMNYQKNSFMERRKFITRLKSAIMMIFIQKNYFGNKYYFKIPKKSLSLTRYNRLEGVKWNRYSFKFLKELEKYYLKITTNPNQDEKYVFFPLHYQPERTTNPEGGFYENQLLVIKLISDALPEDTRLYVKEHPSQFLIRNGVMGRSKSYYDEISTLSNVRLIDYRIDSKYLINRCETVITVTGTAALEAVFSFKPALIFGYPWFKLCPGVHSIRGIKSLKYFFENLTSVEKPTIDELRRYFLHNGRYFNFIYLNPSNKSSLNISREVNIKNITEMLSSYVSKKQFQN